jgi:hypothetical protein
MVDCFEVLENPDWSTPHGLSQRRRVGSSAGLWLVPAVAAKEKNDTEIR